MASPPGQSRVGAAWHKGRDRRLCPERNLRGRIVHAVGRRYCRFVLAVRCLGFIAKPPGCATANREWLRQPLRRRKALGLRAGSMCVSLQTGRPGQPPTVTLN
ncbi:hypothetical protein D8I24_1970 [Cupriavidus necator H850]|nr:hypothetical protein D8I24_1970 [Cupriavidus necator H850]